MHPRSAYQWLQLDIVLLSNVTKVKGEGCRVAYIGNEIVVRNYENNSNVVRRNAKASVLVFGCSVLNRVK